MDNDELSGPPKLKRTAKPKKAPKPVEPELSAEDSAALERRVDAIINGVPEPVAVEGFKEPEAAAEPDVTEDTADGSDAAKRSPEQEAPAVEPVDPKITVQPEAEPVEPETEPEPDLEPEEDPGHDENPGATSEDVQPELEEPAAEAMASAPAVPVKTKAAVAPAAKDPEPELASGEHTVEDVMVSKNADDDVWDDSEDTLNEHVREPSDPDGILAEEKRLKWRRDHPDKPKKRNNKDDDDDLGGGRRNITGTALAILFVILAFGGGGYWVYIHLKAPSKPAVKQTTTTTPATTPATGSVTKPAATTPATTAVTKHYDSQNYTLGFDYPGDWTVNDTTAKLTVTSPDVQLTTASGSQKGHVIVTIQNQQTSIAGYPGAGASAALASQLISYKQPSAVQRAQTYVSFLGYSSSSAIDALFVTGDSGYQQGGTVPMSDVVKGNPLVSITFVTCGTGDDCSSSPSPVAITAASWQSAAFMSPIINLIESVQLQ